MTVYVDPLMDWGWRYGRSCHLIADTNEELHRFALSLNLKREWFQKSVSSPHYDLTAKKRALAVKIGAIELSRKDFSTMIRRWKRMAIEMIQSQTTEDAKQKVRDWLYR